jgi:hypothetical protein
LGDCIKTKEEGEPTSYFCVFFLSFVGFSRAAPRCVRFVLSLFGSVPRQVEVEEEEAIFYFYFIILKEKEILHFHVFPFVLFCARHVSALEPFFLLWPSRAPLYVSFIQRLIVPFPAPYHFPTPHWIVIPRQSNKLVRRKLSSRLIHTRDTTERPPLEAFLVKVEMNGRISAVKVMPTKILRQWPS